ncbi:hypothetical protein PFICI_01945 [Pestalotiopsis fici W106-1]|uniref:Uncharacterized protein n=1 Tax=Pestalotiopsis fici (strain W106-1 / CGMCC3.15140) TaxID=1229662 RepID=W3XRI0_PESFW|nr:uncharacterized protein PFICI_01945 [Pestalotiopsis fici W106-1]ETS88117.1 hypothetical protein PFICI_01945 [Pestalotiopsis fici W106-1]
MDVNIDSVSMFKGFPSVEVDEAWNNVLQYRALAVFPDELTDQESIAIEDGTGRVLVTLGVFDGLYCLDVMRRFSFREFYPDESQISPLEMMDCVDTVRQYIMCYGDISLTTYDWKRDHLLPWPNFRVDHECRDWDGILKWAIAHRASREMLA